MAHMQISTETSTWLLQAKDFLVEARRLKPGPARNNLRQVAKILREIAKVEGLSAGENLIGAKGSAISSPAKRLRFQQSR
jgi:hypothetical protein